MSDVRTVEQVDKKIDARALWAATPLKPREREAIMLRYVEERTLREVGAQIGVSTNRASQIIDKALRTLRRRAGVVPYDKIAGCRVDLTPIERSVVKCVNRGDSVDSIVRMFGPRGARNALASAMAKIARAKR